LIDLILLATVAEGGVLAAWHRRTGRGLSAAAVARMLLPGVCLMLALRAALAGSAWPFVPLALTAALIAHLADVRGRWRG
jgi:fatty acid desaturase